MSCSQLALGPALRIPRGPPTKLHRQALRLLHEVEEHWALFYGGWCDRWEVGPEKGAALAPQWILDCLEADQAWELGAPLHTLQGGLVPSDGQYYGPQWWRPWEPGMEDTWDWCPACLPQVGRGERLTGLHGDPCGFQASPSAMDVPFPPGPAGAKADCDNATLLAAGIALRDAWSPWRALELGECCAPGELWEDCLAFDMGLEDRPWGDMGFVARFQ